MKLERWLLRGFLVAAFSLAVPAATLRSVNAPVNVLSLITMTTLAEASLAMGVLDAGGVRLGGLAITLPSVDGDTWLMLAALPQDLAKLLEKAELPGLGVANAAVTLGNWDFPLLTILAFAAGLLLLLAGAVFGGALLKLSMAEAKKTRGLRRRYVP